MTSFRVAALICFWAVAHVSPPAAALPHPAAKENMDEQNLPPPPPPAGDQSQGAPAASNTGPAGAPAGGAGPAPAPAGGADHAPAPGAATAQPSRRECLIFTGGPPNWKEQKPTTGCQLCWSHPDYITCQDGGEWKVSSCSGGMTCKPTGPCATTCVPKSNPSASEQPSQASTEVPPQ